MTQQELREKLIETTSKNTQLYISKATGINKSTLSLFKTGKLDLYPELFDKLLKFFEDN